jgi:outer membrane protein
MSVWKLNFARSLPASGVLRQLRLVMLGAVSALAVSSGAARAESLKQALTSAYMTNPGLDAQRASLRASDEDVPRAKAGYRPTISGSGDVSVTHTNTKPPGAGDGETHSKGLGLTMSQSLFRGFRVFNSVNVAEASVRAARETLRLTEQTTLSDAIGAYLDVVRDQGILRVRENNVKVLTNELRATQERFAVGEVTKTDVAQAEASRAASLSALDLAKSNLRTDLANYERTIGHPAGQVQEPPPLDKSLPKNLNEAIQLALAEHPNVVQAVYQEQAARHQVDLIRGELLPTVSLDTAYAHRYEPSRTTDQAESTSVTGRVTWQFWNGGEVESRIRQAKHTAVSRLQLIEQQKGIVQAGVVQAWSSLIASRAAVISDQQAVTSNRTALAGVREEEKVGQRTLLDVLNAEQALLNSEVTLYGDKRNLVFASYNMLAAVGRLNAVELSLNSNVYDETAHYHEVKRKVFGSSINYSDGQPEGASEADGKKGGLGRINAANLRPTVTRPSDLNVAPLPRPATSVTPGVNPTDTSKPISITPPARGARKPAVVPATPAAAPSLSPPLDSTLPVPLPPPLPSLSPPLDAPTPITPPAGAAPKSGQRSVPAEQAKKLSGQVQLRGSLDGGWTTKSDKP